MSGFVLLAAGQLAAGHVHRRGGHIVGLFLLVIIAVVVGVIMVQRRRDRRPVVDTAPPRVDGSASGAQLSSVAVSSGAAAPSDVRAGSSRTATIDVPTMAMNEPLPVGHYGVKGLMASEWTKMRSVRSTMWTVAVTVVLGIGVGMLATSETRSHWSSLGVVGRLTFDPTQTSLVGFFIGQFSLGVLGALVVSAEYGTGTSRATFAAAPQRLKVLGAKITDFSGLALVVGELVAFVSFFVGQALLTAPATHATLATPNALRAVVGCGLYITVLGLVAMGLAVIIRNSAGAISAFVGILLVLPIIVSTLPSSIAQDIRKFLPDRIGATMISTLPNHSGGFSPWVGFAILCGYAVLVNAIGAYLLVCRDA